MRVFIAINFPVEVREKIKVIQDMLPDFEGKKTEFSNLHLTLKFLGDVEEKGVERVKELLGKVNEKKFIGKLDGVGVFSENFLRIIWIHLSGAEKLQEAIDGFLMDFFGGEERFMSHVTIARVKRVKDKRAFLESLKKIELPEISFEINEFVLMESQLTEIGPIYRIIEKYNLKS